MKKLTIADVDELYEKDIVKVGNEFHCPVCKKPYKSLKAAETHLAKKSCADYRALYEGTEGELFGAKIYKYIMAEVSPKTKPTITMFKKSKSYNMVMRFVTFLNYHRMGNLYDNYISWLFLRKNAKHMNQVLKYGTEGATLREFKLEFQALDLIDSKNYISIHKDRLIEDPEFLVRSVELCRLGVLALLRYEFFSEVIDKMPIGYQDRLYEFSDEVFKKKEELGSRKKRRS